MFNITTYFIRNASTDSSSTTTLPKTKKYVQASLLLSPPAIEERRLAQFNFEDDYQTTKLDLAAKYSNGFEAY